MSFSHVSDYKEILIKLAELGNKGTYQIDDEVYEIPQIETINVLEGHGDTIRIGDWVVAHKEEKSVQGRVVLIGPMSNPFITLYNYRNSKTYHFFYTNWFFTRVEITT